MASASNTPSIVVFAPLSVTKNETFKAQIPNFPSVLFVTFSSKAELVNEAKAFFSGVNNVDVMRRPSSHSEFATKKGGRPALVLGQVKEDMRISTNTKSVLCAARWTQCEEEMLQYGVPIESQEKFFIALQAFTERHPLTWFMTGHFRSKSNVDINIYSMYRANTMNRDAERPDDIANITKILKGGDESLTLVLRFCSALLSLSNFDSIDYWTAMPSSDMTKQTSPMDQYVGWARTFTKKRKSAPLLLRTKTVPKSQFNKSHYDQAGPAYNSLKLNPEYKSEELKGKHICILDDMYTSGTTFEAARIVLEQHGVASITLVTFGMFRKG